MAIFITAYQRRTSREQITFKSSSGSTPDLAAGDKVRIKIGRSGEPPLLDIVSGTPLGYGSNVTAENPCILELVGDDLVPGTIKPGVYDIEALVVDIADSNRTKIAEQGVFCLVATQQGATG